MRRLLSTVSATRLPLAIGLCAVFWSSSTHSVPASAAPTEDTCRTLASGWQPFPTSGFLATVFGKPYKGEFAEDARAYAIGTRPDVARFKVCPGDDYYEDDGRLRAELGEVNAAGQTRSRPWEKPFWASFKTRVYGTHPSSGKFVIIHQVHQDRPSPSDGPPLPRPPALSFSYSSAGTLSATARCGDDEEAPTSTPLLTTPAHQPALDQGSWVRVTYRAALGQTDGSLDVWVDGQKAYTSPSQGFCLGYPGTPGTIPRPTNPRIKFGVYSAARTQQEGHVIVDVSCMRIATEQAGETQEPVYGGPWSSCG